MANWQRSKNGQKGRNRPKPLSPLSRRGTRQGGGHGRSNEEVKALLSSYRNGLVPG